MTRRRWLGVVTGGAAVAAGIDAVAVEPERVTITRHDVGSGAGPTLRVVQLSDLHLRTIDGHAERIAEAVHALRPALLVLTGDAIDRGAALPTLATFLAMLPTAPTRLAILGNWEHWAGLDVRRLGAQYERSGWQLLRNASRRLRVGDAELLVTGLDDLVGGRPDPVRALAGAAACPNHLLLAHCPPQRDLFGAGVRAGNIAARAAPDIDPSLFAPQLMLAGHTHGGQIAVGGWAPMRPPGSGRYVAGWYRDAPTALYVSRGLGTSVVPMRFGAPPEVAVFDWRLMA